MPRLDRRSFLRGTGVSLALPLLDAMTPRLRSAPPEPPRRMVAVCSTLGIHAEFFTPAVYLAALRDHAKDFTVFAGLSHPDVDGGHDSEGCFLTAAPHPGRGGFRNTISLDQFAVEKLAPDTQFASLTLTTSNGNAGLSVSRNGVGVPADNRPSLVFARLFLDGSSAEVGDRVRKLRDGQSVLDAVGAEAKKLERELGPRDRQRLDEYLGAVREVEKRLVRGQEWATKPKPKVAAKPPKDVASLADFAGRSQLMFDLIHLAFETDSTRVVTLKMQGHNQVPPVKGVTADWHNLSHHGKDPDKIAQLRAIELLQMELLAAFLTKLRGSKENDVTLLDRTAVLFGSNLGNASSHDTRNLPVLLAGGGFRHAERLAFDASNNAPLCRVYVAMLQRLGIDVDAFASGKGRLAGLELA